MAKSAFNQIMEGLTEARDIMEGRADPDTYRVHAPNVVDVKAIRTGLGLTQDQFAGQFGLSVASVREWEQSRRRPDPAARVLLKVIEKNPDAVRQALSTG